MSLFALAGSPSSQPPKSSLVSSVAALSSVFSWALTLGLGHFLGVSHIMTTVEPELLPISWSQNPPTYNGIASDTPILWSHNPTYNAKVYPKMLLVIVEASILPQWARVMGLSAVWSRKAVCI